MTTPFMPRLQGQEEEDPRLFWQQQEEKKQTVLANNKTRDIVSPMADNLSVDMYMERLQPIKDIGRKVYAGQMVSSEIQKQRAMERQAALLAQQREAAFNAAMGAGGSAISGMRGPATGPTQMQAVGGNVAWDRSAAGVADMMRAAGFPESAIAEGIAIARAESGWRENAVNNSNRNGSVDQGLWQINTVHRNESWYPKNLNDPYQSTVAAFNLWKRRGGSWGDWTVYNSGAYRQYLQAVPAARTVSQPVTMPQQTVTTQTGQLRMLAVTKAQSVIGLPYVWGGNSLTKGVDCSGLVQQVYAQLGIKLPRTAQEQAEYGKRVTGSWKPISSLKPGDLVAWYGGQDRGRYIGHIAVYAGNGQIIEAPSAGMTVRKRSLSAKEMSGSGGAFGVSLRFPGE